MKHACALSMVAAVLACAQTVACDTCQTCDTCYLASQQSVNWVGSISVGPVWANSGQTQTFYLTPNIIKTYTATQNNNTLADGEIFIGVQKELRNSLQSQLGFAVAMTSNAKISGNIWDDASPTFNNYTYSYQIKHTHVAIKGKLLSDQDYFVIPWISASLGVGFNNAHGFTNTPLIPQAVTMPNFASQTQTTFTYTLGIGVQKNMNKNWQIGVGYEFADWGQNQLNRAAGQTANTGLSLNHFYTNGVLFNLTYLA